MEPRYTLSYQGNLITSNGNTQTFYGSELQRVEKISPDLNINTKRRDEIKFIKK